MKREFGSGWMKRVILRADDICATATPAALRQVYGLCWENNVPVCMSVIPQSAYHFGATGSQSLPDRVVAISKSHAMENALLWDTAGVRTLLTEKHQTDLVEITLHGWQHHYGELANGSVAEIRRRLETALAVLHKIFPAAQARVLVPPHNYLSAAGLQAARHLGLDVCSTWAATHGGTRWAHWWGRLRRLRGLYFAPPAMGLWSTDVQFIDFESAVDDWAITEHLLYLAERWDSPLVFVQHYWRLLDATGAPNARYARWACWLERMLACPSVQFVRFSDV